MQTVQLGSIIDLLQNVPPNGSYCFALSPLDESAGTLLEGDLLPELCRKKNIQLCLELSPEAATEELEKGWRLFSRRAIAGLPEHTIFEAHRLPYKSIPLSWQEILSAGLAAGYDTLHFGPPERSIPLLYAHKEYEKLTIALFPFSNWVRGRFAPHGKWRKLWEEFTGMTGEEPVIRTSFDKATPLPEGAEERCRLAVYEGISREFLYEEEGDLKVAEGFSGAIHSDGTQPFRKRERSDCVMETAAALAVAGKLEKIPAYISQSERIFHRICNDPANTALANHHPCYSLMSFYDNTPIYYASGNAISALMLAVSTEDEKLVLHALHMMFALLRLTGQRGCIRSSFNSRQSFLEHNWDHYGQEAYFHPCPHRQAAVWSLFLAAWKVTSFQPFLESAEKGINGLMEVYPELPWLNDYSAELVKMLRPLSFLCRVKPLPRYREFLDRVIKDIEKLMDGSGAVRATLFYPEKGLYPPPRSNEEYGTREASLIQKEKDTCCDLLYTQVFALAGFQEAFMATGEPHYNRLADKTAEFLIRTQIHSPRYPRLSGLWMRAFDFDMWEYYGSSADAAWGAWCVESGWVNAPAAMIFSLRKAGKGLFDLLPPEGAWSHLVPRVREEMEKVHPFTPGKSTPFTVLGDET